MTQEEKAAEQVLAKKKPKTKHVTPAVAQADAQSDAGERMSAKKREPTGKTRSVIDHALDLRKRSEQWAKLHSNPKTRAKMDALLDGLSEADQHKVILNGQRISCGLKTKY